MQLISTNTFFSLLKIVFKLKCSLQCYVSGVQPSDSVIHIHIFFLIFFSIIVCYKILNIIPRAIQ